jgi:hypothetical protein
MGERFRGILKLIWEVGGDFVGILDSVLRREIGISECWECIWVLFESVYEYYMRVYMSIIWGGFVLSILGDVEKFE